MFICQAHYSGDVDKTPPVSMIQGHHLLQVSNEGAWVGGYLADRTGDYRAGFVLTASMQMLCAISYVPIAFMVP